MAEHQIKAPATKPVTTSDPKFFELSPANQQEVISSELFGSAELKDYNYTDYGKKCVVNGIVAAQVYLRNNGKDFRNVDIPTFLLSLHNLAVTELNCATIPAEAFCDLRGNVLTFKPQGVGNERLVRKFGVDIKPNTGLHKAWVVHEGDEFELPQFDGLSITPPKWIPKGVSGKVVMVVYPIEKTNGEVEWLMADRASVIANVVAQIRQNSLYSFIKKNEQGYQIKDKYGRAVVDSKARDEFYERINQLAEEANGDLDKFLENPDVKKEVTPTYKSFGSKEAMIERKMKNNALKQYPKDYESSVVAKAAEGLFEDYDESLDYENFIDEDEDVIVKVEKETKEKPAGPKVPDFDVNDETGEIADAKPHVEARTEGKAKEQESEEDYGELL